MENLKSKVKKYMKSVLSDYYDPQLLDINLTRLAEGTADHFNHDEWLDDESHWVWDLAVDAVEEIETTEKRAKNEN